MPKKLTVDQVVVWAFSVRGVDPAVGSARSVGTVCEVVPAGAEPTAESFPHRKSWMTARNEESYLVYLDGRGVYWPQANDLKPASKTEASAVPPIPRINGQIKHPGAPQLPRAVRGVSSGRCHRRLQMTSPSQGCDGLGS